MQTSLSANSSAVASGYKVFMLAIALLDNMTSLNDFLNALKAIYIGRIENKGNVCTLIMIPTKAKYRTTLTNPKKKSRYNI
jgi:hypothetical protein